MAERGRCHTPPGVSWDARREAAAQLDWPAAGSFGVSSARRGGTSLPAKLGGGEGRAAGPRGKPALEREDGRGSRGYACGVGVEAQDLGNTRLRGEAREDAPGCSNLWVCVWRTLARACGASVGRCVRVGGRACGVRACRRAWGWGRR